MTLRIRPAFAALALSAASLAASAEQAPNFAEDTLTGDWGGTRSAWHERGAHVEALYKLDVAHNGSGGLKTGTRAMGLFEGKLTLDLGKLADLEDTTVHVHVLSTLGGQPNTRLVGSAMGINNAEVAANTFRVFQAWIERSFWDGRVAVLAGLYPIDTEFHVTESSGIFLHPSLGAPAELAATGVAGPSIYNTSSIGVRIKVQPAPYWYAMAAVLDGVPGDPNNPRGTHIEFNRGDGAMAIAEFGLLPLAARAGASGETPGGIGKYAFGYYQYTPRFDDFLAVDPATGNPVRRRSRGAYFIAERTVYQEPGDPSQGLAAFVRHGVASAWTNPIAHSTSIGFTYTGLIPGRDEDAFGMTVTRARASEVLRRAQGPMEKTETAWEITYRAQVMPWLAIQPAVQRILNPGFDPALKDAWVFQTRLEVVL